MISGPAMWKKFASLSLATARASRVLPVPGRAVEQHALGRIDAEALEQFGMAQRQLDHLAQRVDRVAHAAEIVIGDVGAALALAFADIRGAARPAFLASMWTMPLGVVSDDDQPHFLQREGGRVEHLADFFRHVGVDPLVAGGGDDVALGQRPAGEAALQRVGRALQPDIVLRGREHDPRRAASTCALLHLDEIARADAGVGALEAVEADDVEPLVLRDRAEARAAVVRLPMISMTSPSLRPSAFIRLSGSRAKPRPLSAGGRFATWTRVVVGLSIVSVSAIQSLRSRVVSVTTTLQ